MLLFLINFGCHAESKLEGMFQLTKIENNKSGHYEVILADNNCLYDCYHIFEYDIKTYNNKYTIYSACNGGTYFGTYEILNDVYLTNILGKKDVCKIESLTDHKFVVSEVVNNAIHRWTYVKAN
jgi:hypothetical protein